MPKPRTDSTQLARWCLLTTYYLLLTDYYLLRTTYYLLLTTFYLLLTTYYPARSVVGLVTITVSFPRGS